MVPPVVKMRSFSMELSVAERRRQGVAVDGDAKIQEEGAVARLAGADAEVQRPRQGIGTHKQRGAVLHAALARLQVGVAPYRTRIQAEAQIPALADAGGQHA